MKSREIKSMEELTALLDELFDDESESRPQQCTTEEAHVRYLECCRMAYDLARDTFEPKPDTQRLFVAAYNNLGHSGVCGATGTLLMEAFCQYTDLKQQQNPDLFKTEFIQSLDNAVLAASDVLEERNDTRTKPSPS